MDDERRTAGCDVCLNSVPIVRHEQTRYDAELHDEGHYCFMFELRHLRNCSVLPEYGSCGRTTALVTAWLGKGQHLIFHGTESDTLTAMALIDLGAPSRDATAHLAGTALEAWLTAQLWAAITSTQVTLLLPASITC